MPHRNPLVASLLAGLGLFGTLCAAGDYAASCRDMKIRFDEHGGAQWLETECRQPPDQPGTDPWFCVKLDLNSCYGNFDGEVAPAPNGRFGDSCHSCKQKRDNKAVISCTCATMDSDEPAKETFFNTNDLIWNHDGTIQCFETQGQSCYPGLPTPPSE
ncbi:hypothetical protein F4780DRAFT_436031 [Xylariomycetidae sp. FL0641]|nr:hypothetical protein F4780DRAFT_436031 [Xylariomycetidae sp. FL0641]